MSHFLYIHKDLSGSAEWNKIGQAITPYSAVRLRQRFCSMEFSLDHVYFGRERHIERLEDRIKERYNHLSGKALTGRNQTELFKVSQEDLVDYIGDTIKELGLNINKVKLSKPYSASSSGLCPLDVPSEKEVWSWAQKIVKDTWGEDEERLLLKQLWAGTPLEDFYA
jgi:hypothetical protein